MTRVSLTAPAKINLTLEIVGILDDGYHELDTVFVTLEVADTLSWEPASQTRLRLTGMPSGMPISVGEDNLVLRALRALERATGRALSLDLELEKRIPAGGGLGGGSADAAALLYGVNAFCDLGLSLTQLEELARPLGADVAFGVRGGVARGRGRGDRLQPLPRPQPRPVMLVFPPFPCPTAEVYRAWRALRARPARGCTERLVQAVSQGHDYLPHLGNDLAPAAEQVQPQLTEIRKLLEERGWGPVLLCGSGSTLSCWNAFDPAEVERTLQPWNCKALLTQVSGTGRG